VGGAPTPGVAAGLWLGRIEASLGAADFSRKRQWSTVNSMGVASTAVSRKWR
jgi:hypothetical protein